VFITNSYTGIDAVVYQIIKQLKNKMIDLKSSSTGSGPRYLSTICTGV